MRQGIVLRYRRELGATYLRRYDDGPYDVNTAAPGRGTDRGLIPFYLLLWGGPRELPWELQFHLNLSFAVGRLHLTGNALTRYVRALAEPATADVRQAVLWSVDHGVGDITSLLHNAITIPLLEELRRDPDIGDGAMMIHPKYGIRATGQALVGALRERKPALVVTTSHGWLPNAGEQFAAEVGLPVDDDHLPLDPALLLESWNPAGAVWYAHACCSAGSNHARSYSGLLADGSSAASVLRLLASRPATVAALPTALLSAKQPLRAFIGHVEPTFDITIRDPATGQALTGSLVEALYRRLYQPFPIGYAWGQWHAQTSAYLDRQISAVHNFDRCVDGADEDALLSGLTAADHRSLVILGDPAGTLPPLPGP